MKFIKVNFLQFTSVVSQHLIIAQVDVNGEQAVKAGQLNLKPVLELLVLGLLSPFL